MDTRHCGGCEDDFYNSHNPYGVKQCWGLKTAKVVRRFVTGTWTVPTEPRAFTEVERPACYRRKGEHFRASLPDFVKHEDVVWLKSKKAAADPTALSRAIGADVDL